VVAGGGSAARAITALLAETSLRVAGVQSVANWDFPEMRARPGLIRSNSAAIRVSTQEVIKLQYVFHPNAILGETRIACQGGH
jgi:hypothetical protein